jgi:exodeoxyribonuclease-3
MLSARAEAPLRIKITTWNINSVRLRMPIVARFLREHAPDVLCLQETKCRDAEFPFSPFRELGYEHIAINGQKGYHGVATISRLPLSDIGRRDFCDKGDARHLGLRVLAGDGGFMLHNFYVPAGGDEPDPLTNPKFAHKLAFVDEMSDWAAAEKIAADRAVLVGDLNIAPLEQDVWNHKALLKVVSHTPVEVEKFGRAFRAGPWVDALRHFVPEPQKLYTWWSYRSPNWLKADKGRRLDHIWVSDRMKGGLSRLDILKDARGWERPSDHVPVSIEVEV